MRKAELPGLAAALRAVRPVHRLGRVDRVEGATLWITGLDGLPRIGDRLCLRRRRGPPLWGEVIALAGGDAMMLPETAPEGVSIGDPAVLHDPVRLAPSDGWLGRVIDPDGGPLDGRPILGGAVARALRDGPPEAGRRRAMGARIDTGMAVFNTLLPLVRGQRLGLFAGSGVGKTRLLGRFAQDMAVDVVVVALIGERGRELRDFIETVLGPRGLARSVVVAATSDRSALARRRCAWSAMCVAEHFRDRGLQVLLLADSITRFAEAHREIATAAGELPALRGFPPSTAPAVMALAERAGPGQNDSGDITAVFSVLVAGSDMDEPVADLVRGTLDGHVILDRAIAERGRFPAIDLLKSTSRSLPEAVGAEENALISEARALLSAYEEAQPMIRAGLYAEGRDALLDRAVRVWAELDTFLAQPDTVGGGEAFRRLHLLLRKSGGGAVTAGQAPGRISPASATG